MESQYQTITIPILILLFIFLPITLPILIIRWLIWSTRLHKLEIQKKYKIKIINSNNKQNSKSKPPNIEWAQDID